MLTKPIIIIHYKDGIPIAVEITNKKTCDSIDILEEILYDN